MVVKQANVSLLMQADVPLKKRQEITEGKKNSSRIQDCWDLSHHFFLFIVSSANILQNTIALVNKKDKSKALLNNFI